MKYDRPSVIAGKPKIYRGSGRTRNSEEGIHYAGRRFGVHMMCGYWVLTDRRPEDPNYIFEHDGKISYAAKILIQTKDRAHATELVALARKEENKWKMRLSQSE